MIPASFVADASPVLWPLAATTIAVLIFFYTVRRRSTEFDIFELGTFYAAIVALYAIFPALAYLANGMEFGPLSDLRLFRAQPLPRELAPVFWCYFAYFAAFGAAYLARRSDDRKTSITFRLPERRTFAALVITLVAIKVFFVAIRVVYGIQSAETYNETYLLYSNLPLILQQLLNHLNGMVLTLEILIMVVLTRNFRKYRWWILGWFSLEFVTSVIGGVGSRTELFVLAVALAIGYHYSVKKLRLRVALTLGVIGMVLFIAMGVLRDKNLAEAGTLNPLSFNNEFEAVFANAYDISQLRKTGEVREIFPEFYFSDVLALIPRQIVPFKKIDVSEWYSKTFYPEYAETGGGLAFGAIAESFVGFGWLDAIWRGAVIGLIFAFLNNRLFRREQTIWSFGLYAWVLTFAYQCFRGGTFILLPRLFYQVFLLFLWIQFLSGFLTLFRPPQRVQGSRVQLGRVQRSREAST